MLKGYAHEQGIRIIGDIPIYVAFDSADSWSRPELFQFDENNMPGAVAGCPPDGFSATGQLWGNPLYNWEYHRKTGFAWWMRRMEYCFRMYDLVRVDTSGDLMSITPYPTAMPRLSTAVGKRGRVSKYSGRCRSISAGTSCLS